MCSDDPGRVPRLSVWALRRTVSPGVCGIWVPGDVPLAPLLQVLSTVQALPQQTWTSLSQTSARAPAPIAAIEDLGPVLPGLLIIKRIFCEMSQC